MENERLNLVRRRLGPYLGRTPSTAGTFRKKFRKNSGKTPERSQSVSRTSPREYGWDAPNPIIQGIWGFQSISRIISPPSTAGDASFFGVGSGEGLSELPMEFPAVLGPFLITILPNYYKINPWNILFCKYRSPGHYYILESVFWCGENKKEVQLKGCGQDNVEQNSLNRKIFAVKRM